MENQAFKDDDIKPLYTVGDRVIMANPIDFFDFEDTKVYTITHVKYMPNHVTYAYRLDNGHLWVNEAWLEPDLFGPKFLGEDVSELRKEREIKALKAEQDYELLSLFYARAKQDEVEHARARARLTEIHAELEALK